MKHDRDGNGSAQKTNGRDKVLSLRPHFLRVLKPLLSHLGLLGIIITGRPVTPLHQARLLSLEVKPSEQSTRWSHLKMNNP